MLISPLHIHDLLTSLLSYDAETGCGLHTALLLVPQGQILACATASLKAAGGSSSAGDLADEEELDEDAAEGDDYDEDEGEDEPYLERPERLRLLSGLASQWEEDESPRVECELGRLLMVPVNLPAAEVMQAKAPLPTLSPKDVSSFVLALNATSDTQWADLSKQGALFAEKWKATVA